MRCSLKLRYDDVANVHFIYIDIFKDDSYSDYCVLTLSANKFEGEYRVYTDLQQKVIEYLINDKVIEVIEGPIIYDGSPKHGIYKIRLSQSKMLELL